MLGSLDVVPIAQGAQRRAQVLQQYALFADGQLGRWGRRSDGTPVPGVRALVSPVAQLFFGEAVRRPPLALGCSPTHSLQCVFVPWQAFLALRVPKCWFKARSPVSVCGCHVLEPTGIVWS